MNTTNTTKASIFLTDYASYNNGTQFEFGHWINLNDFSDAEELSEYIENHFKEADEKSPLCSPREEIMITDFEGFPSELYNESGMNFENLFEYLNLYDDDKMKVNFILEQGEDFTYAMRKYEDVYFIDDTNDSIYYEFEMYFPDAIKAEESNNYITIDYDRFKRENYIEFQYEGESYLINENWNY